jgi:hypothetical protein
MNLVLLVIVLLLLFWGGGFYFGGPAIGGGGLGLVLSPRTRKATRGRLNGRSVKRLGVLGSVFKPHE